MSTVFRDHGSWLTQNSRARTRFVMWKPRFEGKKNHILYANTLFLRLLRVYILRVILSIFKGFTIICSPFLHSLCSAPVTYFGLVTVHKTSTTNNEQQKKKKIRVNLCVALVPKLYPRCIWSYATCQRSVMINMNSKSRKFLHFFLSFFSSLLALKQTRAIFHIK